MMATSQLWYVCYGCVVMAPKILATFCAGTLSPVAYLFTKSSTLQGAFVSALGVDLTLGALIGLGVSGGHFLQ